MIQHATHAQNNFALLETGHLIQLNIPTRTALFSSPPGLLIIVTAQEKIFSSLPSVTKEKSLPTEIWEELILVAVHMSTNNPCWERRFPVLQQAQVTMVCLISGHYFPGPRPSPRGVLLKFPLYHSASSALSTVTYTLYLPQKYAQKASCDTPGPEIPVAACLLDCQEFWCKQSNYSLDLLSNASTRTTVLLVKGIVQRILACYKRRSIGVADWMLLRSDFLSSWCMLTPWMAI